MAGKGLESDRLGERCPFHCSGSLKLRPGRRWLGRRFMGHYVSGSCLKEGGVVGAESL